MSGSSNNSNPISINDFREKSTFSLSAGEIGAITTAVIIFLSIFIIFVIYWMRRLRTQQESGGVELGMLESSGNRNVSLMNELRIATNNFSEDNIVGRGASGIVYKGVLHGSQIAVKRIDTSSRGSSEFDAEVQVLETVRHRHLVSVKDHCTEGDEKFLVYEYMSNGTLREHIADRERYEVLSWEQRLTIALDVARAMEYLHRLTDPMFIHRDLKTSNILLGDDMRAKVSDFGLVKPIPHENYSMETRMAGTFGYVAPEYAMFGRLSTKADVYSYGVVLMEILLGRKALDISLPHGEVNIVQWFRRNRSPDMLRNILDPALHTDEEMFSNITLVADLAAHCTAEESSLRPDMRNVVSILSPLVEQWKPPSPPKEEDGDSFARRWQGEGTSRWAEEGTSLMGSLGTQTSSTDYIDG